MASIEMARGQGVQDTAITAMLQDSDLLWDAAKGVVDTQALKAPLER